MFRLQKPVGSVYICDVCNLRPELAGLGIYDDPKCNFTVCEACYEQLPENLDERYKAVNEKLLLQC